MLDQLPHELPKASQEPAGILGSPVQPGLTLWRGGHFSRHGSGSLPWWCHPTHWGDAQESWVQGEGTGWREGVIVSCTQVLVSLPAHEQWAVLVGVTCSSQDDQP